MNFAKVDKELPKHLVSRFISKDDQVHDEEADFNGLKPYNLTRSSTSTNENISERDLGHSYSALNNDNPHNNIPTEVNTSWFQNLKRIMVKYVKFIGPGLMVSVSYMDPGNYSTAVAAGSAHKYKLLCSILVSNILAAFLQILCAKLGAVTGLDLAQNCRKHLPRKLNIAVYVLAEIAIIATDLAEVIGTAISLNILFNIPLIIGVILTIVDVLIVLMAYKPNGDMKVIRIFEAFVSILVMLTVACFTVELIDVDFKFSEVMKGFLPSEDLVQGDGLYLSLAILGATVMPHSLYLGSGLVQPRLREFDISNGNYKPDVDDENNLNYKPSMDAINDIMDYTITELIISLFTVALFVNSAILIVSGSTLVGESETDLFSIYNLLSTNLSKTAGLIFVLALLFSGQSAGIVCTLAGQMVSEGFLHWTLPPTLRRLITRSVAITPCLVLVLVAGRSGLSGALNASQVILCLLLPFVSAPLIYFTSSKEIMRVNLQNNCYSSQPEAIGLMDLSNAGISEQNFEENSQENSQEDLGEDRTEEVDQSEAATYKDMSNSRLTNFFAIMIWLLISGLNFFLLISFASGKDVSF